jgi:O-acetyl-ADP-ribose deacetylase (regulator of RNase III)
VLLNVLYPSGIFGFDTERAAHVALRAVREWLEDDMQQRGGDGDNGGGGGGGGGSVLESVVFCCFQEQDRALYAATMPRYFPPVAAADATVAAVVD